MASVNKVILVGNLGADPDVKTFDNGGKIANVSIATTDRWTDRNTGEQKESTEWHRVSFSDRLADIVAQYLRKGSQVYVEGSIKTRKWQDQNGQDRYATEIRATSMQMLGSREQGQQQAPQPQNGYQQGGQGGYGQAPQGQGYPQPQNQAYPHKGNPVGTRYATNADGTPVYPPQPLPPEQQQQGWANHAPQHQGQGQNGFATPAPQPNFGNQSNPWGQPQPQGNFAPPAPQGQGQGVVDDDMPF